MNERPTPETDAKDKSLHGNFAMCYGIMLEHARKLERELAELRELYDLDTQTLRAERDEARDALRVFDLIKAVNNPDGEDMPMYVTACQDCGGEYGTPAEGWRAIVRLEYDSIEVAQAMGGSFQESVTEAIKQATEREVMQ